MADIETTELTNETGIGTATTNVTAATGTASGTMSSEGTGAASSSSSTSGHKLRLYDSSDGSTDEIDLDGYMTNSKYLANVSSNVLYSNTKMYQHIVSFGGTGVRMAFGFESFYNDKDIYYSGTNSDHSHVFDIYSALASPSMGVVGFASKVFFDLASTNTMNTTVQAGEIASASPLSIYRRYVDGMSIRSRYSWTGYFDYFAIA